MMFMLWLQEFRGYWQFSIFIKFDECKFIILVPQCSDDNLRMLRGGILPMGGNTKGYEVAEHISKKVEVNWWMLSTLKIKNHLKHKPRGKCWDINGWTSGNCFGRPSTSTFLAINLRLEIETQPKRWWIIWEGFVFARAQTVGTIIFLVILGLTLINLHLEMI